MAPANDFRMLIFCAFSVAVSFAFPPCPFPPLINLNEILVLRYVNPSAPTFRLSLPVLCAVTPGLQYYNAHLPFEWEKHPAPPVQRDTPRRKCNFSGFKF